MHGLTCIFWANLTPCSLQELTEFEIEDQKVADARIFPSGLAQRLVMSRLIRKGRCHPDSMLDHKDHSNHRLHQIQKMVTQKKSIPASYFHEVLECRGGYRPKASQIFPAADGRPIVAAIAGLVQLDPNFILRPQVRKTPSWPRSWANFSLL
jgi:hypothetical protein